MSSNVRDIGCVQVCCCLLEVSSSTFTSDCDELRECNSRGDAAPRLTLLIPTAIFLSSESESSAPEDSQSNQPLDLLCLLHLSIEKKKKKVLKDRSSATCQQTSERLLFWDDSLPPAAVTSTTPSFPLFVNVLPVIINVQLSVQRHVYFLSLILFA